MGSIMSVVTTQGLQCGLFSPSYRKPPKPMKKKEEEGRRRKKKEEEGRRRKKKEEEGRRRKKKEEEEYSTPCWDGVHEASVQ
ncbi:hypothetical protein HGM15179_015676 [Zosterops borbonicus]|uniref:Uncharacterized protein n=1 Tax=Zosterops borbonicus TaxID=364589 RepID=A0A8K1LF11_9PASS|nr:hypothetical protein HGM15179_015676 [Zosterops borbonicus]